MNAASFPRKIQALPKYDGPFDAFHLAAQGCQVYFASYPANTKIAPHRHDTDNYGVITQGELVLEMAGEIQRISVGEWYHVPAQAVHSARFEQVTSEIEFWFEA